MDARDIVEATMASAEVLRLRILAYDLSASPFLQSVETDGEDKTVTGVLLTLRSGVYTNLRPLAWAWDGFDKARRFSIKRWLAEDYKGIRTVIVQYSAEYAALSTLVEVASFAASRVASRTPNFETIATVGSCSHWTRFIC